MVFCAKHVNCESCYVAGCSWKGDRCVPDLSDPEAVCRLRAIYGPHWDDPAVASRLSFSSWSTETQGPGEPQAYSGILACAILGWTTAGIVAAALITLLFLHYKFGWCTGNHDKTPKEKRPKAVLDKKEEPEVNPVSNPTTAPPLPPRISGRHEPEPGAYNVLPPPILPQKATTGTVQGRGQGIEETSVEVHSLPSSTERPLPDQLLNSRSSIGREGGDELPDNQSTGSKSPDCQVARLGPHTEDLVILDRTDCHSINLIGDGDVEPATSTTAAATRGCSK